METLSSSLLATKLYIPVQPTRFVARQPLTQRLQLWQNQGYRLTLVSAPAGYGKTMLVVDWIRKENLPAAWISLDEGDNDFVRFIHYLITSLRKLHPHLGDDSLKLLDQGQTSVQGLLTPLINQLTDLPDGHPFLLVLDDYHLIQAQAIHDAISFLVEYFPTHGHLVLITRADPPLPLARWRGRGQLNELRLVDLRFSEAETEAYLNLMLKLRLSTTEVDTLVARSEGWIAGLQMAAASIRECDNVADFMHALSGSQRNILDYLLEEVLQHLPGKTQDFLIHTSFLDRLCGPLCDAVLGLSGMSQSYLEGLERENLFTIPLDDHRCWYRYHHLFADLLQTRLFQLVDSSRLAELRQRASQWFELQGLQNEAIELAFQAQDFRRAAALMDQIADEMLKCGELVTFKRWLSNLPPESYQDRPSLCLYHAWVLLWSGAPAEMINASLEPIKNLEAQATALQQASLLPLQAFMCMVQGDISTAVQLARAALDDLPAQYSFLRSMAMIVLASAAQLENRDDRGEGFHDMAIQEGLSSGNLLLSLSMLSSLANLLQKEGRLSQAEQKYQQAFELALDTYGQPLPIATRAMVGLASIALERNHLSGIEAQLQEAVQLSQSWATNTSVNAYLILARSQICLGKMQAAQKILDHARFHARQFDLTEMDDLSVEILQQRLNLMQNNLQAVTTWAEMRGLQGINPITGLDAGDFTNAHMRKYEYPVLARLYMSQNLFEEALELLDVLLPHVRTARRMALVIEALSLRAQVLYRLERLPEALNDLEDALRLAEPEKYVRLFVDDSPALQPLLTVLKPRLTDPGLVNFANELCNSSVSSQTHGPESIPLIEPLSARELEILRLLVQTSLSAPQIAEELYISVSTVRTHIKSIYSKLDVHGRLDAASCARKYKLI
jgi:LuxR family maltose regulon positive regulatory protein